jgi:hypothetical protein
MAWQAKVAPAHPKDSRALEYALLAPEEMAVDEINAITDVSVTRRDLVAIVGKFADQAPPYPSTERPPSSTSHIYIAGAEKSCENSNKNKGVFGQEAGPRVTPQVPTDTCL